MYGGITTDWCVRSSEVAKEKPVEITPERDLPIGSRIRLLRQAMGLHLSALAREVDYDRGYLSHVEQNQANPSNELVERIAQQLGLSADALRRDPIGEEIKLRTLERVKPESVASPALSIKSPLKRRTLGQRIERAVTVAHLTEEEESIVCDHLVAITTTVIAMIKAARSLREE